MTFLGNLLKESLKDEAILGSLAITRQETWQVENPAPFQPGTWHAVWFEGDKKQADEVAQDLSRALQPDWYCNLVTEAHTYVIFGGKVFKYPRGDQVERSKAQAYGRSVGIPEPQLDWGEDYSQ